MLGEVVGSRRVAELFLPVGGEKELVCRQIPLKDHIGGLLHNDAVALQGETEVFLHMLAAGDVQHDAVNALLTVSAGMYRAAGQQPHRLAVPTLDAVLQLHSLSGRPGAAQLLEDLRSVLGADQFHEPVLKPGAQLLAAVTAQIQKAGADAEEGKSSVDAALVHAAGDVFHQVLQFRAALLQPGADVVDLTADGLLFPQGTLPDIVLPPDLVPVGSRYVQMHQAHAALAAGTYQGDAAAQAGHGGSLHRPGAQPARDDAGV